MLDSQSLFCSSMSCG